MAFEKRKQEAIFIYPALIILGVIVLFPLLYALVTSFFSTSLKESGLGSFVGLDNYLNVFKNEYFAKSIWVTFIFTVTVVFFEFIFGFIIALLLNRKIIGKKVFFTIIITPMLITPVAIGLIWRLLLHPQLGIVNYVLNTIGLSSQAWLADKGLALMSVVLIDIWHQVPFMVLILLAGLVSLPKEPYEAAFIDGASSIQTFFRITLPMMIPTMAVAILLRTINALKTYDLIYILTKGGPGSETEIISYHIYKQAFTFLETGYSSAMSYLLLFIVVILSFLFVKTSKRDW
ncbi:carbohydrate ABC transporter permease [Virgibacillus sp. W0430]|uniref:carbohydrate ABC transporter permease n=1 Tax=Virgibacillus sp. W0430 TaxID=3391580 RepID=UPI003F4718A4